jgi:hypothetical protein
LVSSSLAVECSLVTNPVSLGDIDPREVSTAFPALPIVGAVPMPWSALLEPRMHATRTDLWFYHPDVGASDDGGDEAELASGRAFDSC